MKRLLILFVILIFVFSPRIYWSLKESKPLIVNVVDKTVPKKDYREHNGFFQVLDYEKVINESGNLYDIGKDYFGFDPYDKVTGPIYNVETEPDMIYVTDTYGVYDDDLEEEPDGDRSTLVDGGMGLLEWNAVMASKGEETTLIAEFNSFASPTEESVSEIMQNNLGIKWDGWIGRYFNDFESDEIPAWLIADYEEQFGEKWSFEKDGLAFVHNEGQVVVLDKEANKGKVHFTPNEQGRVKFPAIKSSPYAYWFDIVKPIGESEPLAEYSLDLTEQGLSMLKDAGIPIEFPAIVHNPSSKTYYFAGDYADYEKRAFTKWQGLPTIYQYFAADISEFYWKSYFPLMSGILREVEDEKER